MKPRISAYLSDDIVKLLKVLSDKPGANQSAIIEAALKHYLSPEGDKSLDAALVRRLDHVSGQLDKLDRDVTIVVEVLALFVRYYLTITPPLAQSDHEAANALGRQRFEFFIAQVGKRLGGAQNLVGEVLERIVINDPDLFARASQEPGISVGSHRSSDGGGSHA